MEVEDFKGWDMLPAVKAALKKTLRKRNIMVWPFVTRELAEAVQRRLIHDHGEVIWKKGFRLEVDKAREREGGWTFDLILVPRISPDNPLAQLLRGEGGK